jgi:hypothetical protein
MLSKKEKLIYIAINIFKTFVVLYFLIATIELISRMMYYQYHFYLFAIVFLPVFFILSFFEKRVISKLNLDNVVLKFIPHGIIFICLMPFVVIQDEKLSFLFMIVTMSSVILLNISMIFLILTRTVRRSD